MTIPRMGQGQWKNMSGTFPSFLYSGGERVQRSQRVAFFINWSAAAYRSQVTGKSEQMPTSERLKTWTTVVAVTAAVGESAGSCLVPLGDNSWKTGLLTCTPEANAKQFA